MLSFASDYIAGAHPAILERLSQTNLESLSGYGSDPYCRSAIEKIKASCKCPDGEVYFLVGGTQANQFVISALLDDSEGVIAADTGHVSLHEAGAIEYTGHKVLQIKGQDGKLCAAGVEKCLKDFYEDGNHEHMVWPGMVYISYPTEYGTLYSKQELKDLYEVCTRYRIPLFIDGARLGYGLAADESDLKMEDIASLCDVFYIGGTKVGALCGEAVVFTGRYIPKNLLTKIKQHGALLAKGRLLGVQFDTLFTDDLYMEIGRHAIDKAHKLKKIFAEKGYEFYIDSPTNQQFVIMSEKQLEALSKKVDYSFWEKYDDSHTVVRFATGWSTTDADLDALSALLP